MNNAYVFHKPLGCLARGVICCVGVLFADGDLAANDDALPGKEGVQELGAAILSGITANLERIESGSFRAYGRREVSSKLTKITDDNREELLPESTTTDWGWGQVRFADLEYFSAFNFAAGEYRLDRIEVKLPSPLDGPEEATTTEPDPAVKQAYMFCSIPEWIWTWSSGAGQLAISAPSDTDGVAIHRPLIDVRTLATDFAYTFSKREKPLDRWHTTYNPTRLRSVTRESDELYRLEFRAADPAVAASTKTIWCDESRGMLPIRLEVSAGGGKPALVATTSWTQHDGVWVPESYHAVSYYPPVREQIDLAFEWESVNQTIAETVFSHEHVQLPPGTAIIDGRLGRDRAVIASVVGSDGSREGEVVKIPVEPVGAWPRILLFANVALLVAIALFFGRRRWNERRRRDIPADKAPATPDR